MEEKRNIERRHLIYYLRLFSRPQKKLLGHIVDITAEGIMLMSEKPIPVGKDFKLRMYLSDLIIGQAHLDLEARSLWCKPDINPDFYDTGFVIINLSFNDAKLIYELIDQYGFRA
jgi:hypothetical protein